MKHLVTIFAAFLLIAGCVSSKYNVEGKKPSPYVGKWMWEPEGQKGISCLYVGERNDSLFISVYGKFPWGWYFLPNYAGDPINEIYSADICMPLPKKGNRVVVEYSYSPTNIKSLPMYKEVSLTLKDENTLVWKVKLNEEMNIPTKMVFKREGKNNFKFGDKVNFMYLNK